MRLRFFVTFIALFCCFPLLCKSADTPVKITGTVKSGKAALADVAVTDGYHIVYTDEHGRFDIIPDDRSRFIYISTPAGYLPPVEEGLVKFYKPIDSCEGFDFVLTRKKRDDNRHGFIAVADPQVMNEAEIDKMKYGVADIARTVAEHKKIDFHGMGCGDIVFDRQHLFDNFNKAMLPAGIPFYHSIGNHDMTYSERSFEASISGYEAVYGPSWYSYNVGKIHYVVLNNCFYIARGGYIGYLDENQLQWLEQDLRTVPEGSTVIITLHIPTTLSDEDRNNYRREDISNIMTNPKPLYSLLEGYNAHIISGHYHTSNNAVVNDSLYEHNIAALSGAWWQGPVSVDGTPCGYGVFLAEGDDLSWYYKSVGYDRSYQMRIDIEIMRDHRTVYAHVWNTDPDWKVELYEDGTLSGQMERTARVDPDVLELYSNSSQLEHKWISPEKSPNFYRRQISENTRTVEVMVTDRFGNVYGSKIEI